MDASKIGLFIKKKRKEKKMTQAEIAAALNISPQAVSKWERFESLPDIASLPDLASVLEVSVEEIFNTCVSDNKNDFEEVINLINILINNEFFEKLLTKLKQKNNLIEKNIPLNLVIFLNNQQKDRLLDIILSAENYFIVIDEIIQYLNNNQRKKIIDKILEKNDFEYLEQLIPFISRNTKTEIIIELLKTEKFEVIEDIFPFLNKDQKDLIIQDIIKNKTKIFILENYLPFFDLKQKNLVQEILLKMEEIK